MNDAIGQNSPVTVRNVTWQTIWKLNTPSPATLSSLEYRLVWYSNHNCTWILCKLRTKTSLSNYAKQRLRNVIFFFLMLALFRRASFWPPFMVYISVNNAQTLQITFLQVILVQLVHRHTLWWYSNSNYKFPY